jgi:hypothetical protein
MTPHRRWPFGRLRRLPEKSGLVVMPPALILALAAALLPE